MYDFDKLVDRHNTGSTKWDGVAANNYPADTLAMWTADMDFEVCPAISEAICQRAEHKIYGYGKKDAGSDTAVCAWMKKRFGWDAKPEWIVNTPGVVCALKMIVQTYTQPEDAIIILRPVYYPFSFSIEQNGRRIVNSPLDLKNGRYHVNYDDFEAKIIENNVKMFILCNPHNPVSVVWTAEELKKMGDICHKHNVMVVSDEIHQDFVFSGHQFTPFLMANPQMADNTIVCTAPSKTFNVAGLKFSNIFVPNEEKRSLLMDQLNRCGINTCNIFGDIACKAAYENGAEWFDELLAYIEGNAKFFREYLQQEIPGVIVLNMEGTYLAWADFSIFGLNDEDLDHFMIYDAHLWLDGGTMFGIEGSGFQRFNLAYPRSVIKDCVDRIKKAAKEKNLI